MNIIKMIGYVSCIFLGNLGWARELHKVDTTGSRLAQDLRFNPADTAKIDTTNVVTAEYSQETKKAQFQERFKGFVKLNTFYDFEGVRNTEGFNPFDIVQDSVLNKQLMCHCPIRSGSY